MRKSLACPSEPQRRQYIAIHIYPVPCTLRLIRTASDRTPPQFPVKLISPTSFASDKRPAISHLEPKQSGGRLSLDPGRIPPALRGRQTCIHTNRPNDSQTLFYQQCLNFKDIEMNIYIYICVYIYDHLESFRLMKPIRQRVLA